ncbi:MAG: histidine kinase [ANME-2 cluster archaeon]|nr:MAG: histidine kinase [ANME-2 cluster archaeon]
MKNETVRKLLSRNSKWNWLVILLISILLMFSIIFLGLRSNNEVQSIVQDQYSEQQLLFSKQIASSIREFLNEKTIIVELVAHHLSKAPDDEIQTEFMTVINETTGIYAIQFLNESGVVTYGYPVENTPFGYDLYNYERPGSDGTESIFIDTFEWIKNNKETNITRPVNLLEGEMGAFMWTPVFDGNQFKGAVLAIIKVSDISQRLVEKDDNNKEIQVLDNYGTVLYDNTNGYHIGDIYSDTLHDSDPLLIIVQYQLNGSEGTSYYFKDGTSDRKLITYSPITWLNQKWSVSVTSPVSETDGLIQSVYLRQGLFMGISVGFIMLLSFSFILVISSWNTSLESEVKEKTVDLKKSNDLLQNANEKLREFDTLKSKFLSIISHELKTPLTAMRISSEVLQDDDLSTSKRKQLSELVIRNVDRLTSMVNDLLDISMIESGKLKYHMEMVDLRDIINTALETLNTQLENKGLNIATDLPDDISRIEGDKDKLIQVFVNLLSNASKFTSEGGNVGIKVTEFEHYIEVRVNDDGIGISKDELENIFSDFYQIDNSSSRSYGGAGLGLAIIKGIAEGHGGSIKAESIPGDGSEFIVVLNKKDK